MSHKLRDISRQIVTPEGRVEIDRLCQFLISLQEWQEEFLQKDKEAGKKPKATLLKHLDTISRILTQYSACVSAITGLLPRVLVTLLGPSNDAEIRQAAWEIAMLFFDACSADGVLSMGQIAPVMAIGLSLSVELRHVQRLPIGSPGNVTAEDISVQVGRLMEFVEGAKQRNRALFWWRIVGECVMPHFFDRKQRRELRAIKKELSLRFLRALTDCLRRFPTLTLHEIARNSRKLSIYVIEVLREVEEMTADVQVHDLALEFFKIGFPCCYANRDTGKDIDVRKGIMASELPPHLWMTHFTALPAGSVTQFFNIVHTFEEGSAAFMNLAHIGLKLVRPFFARIQGCRDRSDEFWDMMALFISHALRAMMIANEIMNAGGSHIQEMLTFLILNQEKDMGPFVCSFVIALVYHRMQVNELPKAVYASMQNVLSVASRNTISTSKEPQSYILAKLGGQLAAAMAPNLLSIADKDLEHNPVLFEYRLNKGKYDGPEPELYNCYFYSLSQEAQYKREHMVKMIKGLCCGSDEKVSCRIMSGFMQTLLDISVLKKAKYDFFPDFSSILYELLSKCTGVDCDSVYHSWFRILLTRNSVERLDRKLVHQWYRVTSELIQRASDQALFDGMQAYLSLIPGSLALVPQITALFSIDCVGQRSGRYQSDLTVFIRFLISLAFMKPTCKCANSSLFVHSFGASVLLTIVQLEKDFRKIEIEDAIVYLLLSEMIGTQDSDQLLDPEIRALIVRLVTDITPESHILMSKLAILPCYYHLVAKKCPNLIEHIIDVLPKQLYSATPEFFHWVVVFLVNTMIYVQEESIVNRCMAMLAYETDDPEKREMLSSATVYLLTHVDREGHSFELNPDMPAIVLSREQDMVWQIDLSDEMKVRTIRRNGCSNYRINYGQCFKPVIDKWLCATPGVSVLLSAFQSMSGDSLTVCPDGLQYAADSMNLIRRSRETVVSVVGDPSDPEFVAFVKSICKPRGYLLNTRFKLASAQGENRKIKEAAIVWSNNWDASQELVTRYNFVIRKGQNGYFSIRQERLDRFNRPSLFGFGQVTVPKCVVPIVVGWAAATTVVRMNKSKLRDSMPPLENSFGIATIV